MIGQTISHYAPKAHPPLADKIIDKPHQKKGRRLDSSSGQVGECGMGVTNVGRFAESTSNT